MAYGILKREYDFWMKERITPNGLNRYGYDMNTGNIEMYASMIRRRLAGLDLSDRTDEDVVENFMADAESGWDFNPRCEGRQTEYNFIDLNSILYAMECSMAFFASELTSGEEGFWQQRARERRDKIRSIMYDGETFRDYNFVKNTFSPVFSCASFYPLWAKIASEEEAASTVKLLPLLEREHGLATCQPIERKEKYQWDYPNCWASLQYLIVYGLDNYGYYEDAVRIATKYVRS